MAGLQSTYGYDRSKMTKANKMLKTGQVPMDINTMPGLVEDVSDAEEWDAESGINALQGGDVCYFCKKPGHQKRVCRKFDEWKNGSYGGGQIADMAKSMAAMQEVLKKLVPEVVFP